MQQKKTSPTEKSGKIFDGDLYREKNAEKHQEKFAHLGIACKNSKGFTGRKSSRIQFAKISYKKNSS